ncbi:MAG: hypothetical protein ACTSQJ_09240 [Promethearchaeota archaeon]
MAKKKSTPQTKKKPVEEAPESKQITYKKLKVNFWRTRLHGEELGIYQTLKYQAKTRYFAKNFDIEGICEEDGQKKWIIAYNKDDWKNKPDDQKRLILRLFTILEEKMGVGKGGNFVAGVELSITHSLLQSFEIKHPAPVFFVTLPKTKYLTKIVKGWRLKGTRWTFPLLPEKPDDHLVMVKARGTVGLGVDYDIWIGKKKIARLDGQRVQKEWEIEIYDEDYAKDRTFLILLLIFGCICNFMKDTDKIIEKLFKEMKETGATSFKPPKQELALFKNPRFIRG